MSKITEDSIEDEEDEGEEPTTSCKTVSQSNQVQSQLPSFDRLKPRVNSNSNNIPNHKRKVITSMDGPPLNNAEKKFKGSKQEYLKLRNLVPALNEREDISKVEIIEETIRYIDALHHQLAAKNSTLASISPPSPCSDDSSTPSTSSVPLQNLEESQHLNHRSRKPSSVPSSSGRSSSQDVKAAVENIQAMFAAYLEQNNDANS